MPKTKTFKFNIDINKPVPQVFAYVANLETSPKYELPMLEVKKLSGNGQVGTKYAFKRKIPMGSTKGEVTVTDYVQDQKFAFEGGWAGGVKPVCIVDFSPKSGGTAVTFTLPMQVKGIAAYPPISWLFASDMNKTGKWLQNLKTNRESTK